MKIFDKIMNRSTLSKGDFESLFSKIEIPTLPAATTLLLSEATKDDPDLKKIEQIISTNQSLSAKVLRLINSALYSLPNQISSVFHAINMLGMNRVREIALAFAMVEGVPRPDKEYFNHEAFWADSLLRALLARSFARFVDPTRSDEAFTAMLMADVAVPVLIKNWEEEYEPALMRWADGQGRLDEIERELYKWDHGLASAWILQKWNFPRNLVDLVSTHTLSLAEVEELKLGDPLALPMAVASQGPSVLLPDTARAKRMMDAASQAFNLDQAALRNLIFELQVELEESRKLFEIDADMTFNQFMAYFAALNVENENSQITS
jgi:HD-like signal output (HDOD) protein